MTNQGSAGRGDHVGTPDDDGIMGPLRQTTFRRIWLASLISNLGTLIQGVGVAWAMTQMSSSADLVALVQTALNLPVMLIAIPAGAIADVHDRRVVALCSLVLALVAATVLTTLAAVNLLTPALLLILCFAVGCGSAMMSPAWQASVSEQVPPESLASAVALNGISYNIARSVGPAIGGIVVATAGTVAAFAVNTLSFLPLILALFLWKRVSERSRLPPERLGHAIELAVRYIANSPPIRTVLIRAAAAGVLTGAILALLPVVTHNQLHGDARTYGVLLSAFGIGAVMGAVNTARIRKRLSAETAIRACTLAMSAGMVLLGVSDHVVVAAMAMVVAGAGWILMWTLFNVAVQYSAPRWVTARSLAAYQAASAAGLAFGSWGWGHVADMLGVESTLLVCGGLLLVSIVIGAWLRMPEVNARAEETSVLDDPVAKLHLRGHDGPLVIEIEYRVANERAETFNELIQQVQLVRQRNGAYGWSIARDIAEPELWIERYHCPTWHDYLRMRSRSTRSERALEDEALGLHAGPGNVRVRRMLERPLE
jgi:MFS family permease